MTNKVITKNFKGGVLRQYDSRFIRSSMNEFNAWVGEIYDIDDNLEKHYKRVGQVVSEPNLPPTGSLIQIKPKEGMTHFGDWKGTEPVVVHQWWRVKANPEYDLSETIAYPDGKLMCEALSGGNIAILSSDEHFFEVFEVSGISRKKD